MLDVSSRVRIAYLRLSEPYRSFPLANSPPCHQHGGLLASGGFDGTVRLWEVPSGRLLATVQGHSDGVWDVALSGDGGLLASASTVRRWEAVSGQLRATLEGHSGVVYGVALPGAGCRGGRPCPTP